MKEIMEVVFGLFGGLAIFIYGMNMMSECLQKAAGEKMKNILALLTKNPVMGALAGALTTAVLQSSSATTVMAIGFVSAELMTLPQAISIIIGANIGTTMTAQLLAFKISDYILAFVFVGFIIQFIAKSEKTKSLGQTLFAFGLLFLGIETMGDVMKPLASSPIFTDLIGRVSDMPVLGVAVGTLMTLVVQSSSATIAVLQNFASQPAADGVTSIIGLTGAIPILLGDNIGTTITALMASVGQSKNAKRTALAHCTFNVSGCLLFLCLIKPFAYVIRMISTSGPEVEVIARQIANAHTMFNLVMTLIWIPLIGVLVKIVMMIVPNGNEPEKNTDSAYFLDKKLSSQPIAAFQMIGREVLHCSDMVLDLLNSSLIVVRDYTEQGISEIEKKAETVRDINNKITEYLADMFSSGVMTEEQATQSAELIQVLSDIDRIGELCTDVAQSLKSRSDSNLHFSDDAVNDLEESLCQICTMFGNAIESIRTGNPSALNDIHETRSRIFNLHVKMRKDHMKRVKKGKCDVNLTVPFNQLLHCIDRMSNSCLNIADAANGRVNMNYFLLQEGEPFGLTPTIR